MITAAELTAEVLRLADEHPDAVYVGPSIGACCYAAGTAAGGTGCLFGQALTNLGADRAALKEADENNEPINRLVDPLGIDAPSLLISEWGEAQACQDGGDTWAAAVRRLRSAS